LSRSCSSRHHNLPVAAQPQFCSISIYPPPPLLPLNALIPLNLLFSSWAQPYFWYFTSKDGQLIRKTKDRILVDQIFETFTGLQSEIGNIKKENSPDDDKYEVMICGTNMTSEVIQDENEQGVKERINMEYF
jgi:hypothetical protein